MSETTIVQGIKLVSGDELVAKIDSVHDDHVTVKDPLLVIMSNGPNGLVANFIPWSIIAEGLIQIEKHSIAARYRVPKEVENNYIQNTTGIQIVSDAPKTILKG